MVVLKVMAMIVQFWDYLFIGVGDGDGGVEGEGNQIVVEINDVAW